MPNQELQNYINQSRASGVPDEQIRQTLAAQGWSEADLNEAFGQVAASVSTASVSSVGTGWLSAKVVTVAVTLLLIGGIGAYIVFSTKKPSNESGGVNSSQNQVANNPPSQNKAERSLKCEDLLPADDFKRVTQKDLSKYLPKWDIVKDGLLGCEVLGDYGLPWLSFGVIARWEEGDNRWDVLKEQALKLSNQYSKYEQVSNIGSDAYFLNNSLNALSSNKKYTLDVSAPTKEQSIEIAKIIDANLSKY